MKIDMSKELHLDTMVGHLILECLTNTLGHGKKFEAFLKDYKEKGGHILDVQLLVNGKEMNLEKFVDHWQSQVHENIRRRAEELFKEKFSDVEILCTELMDDLKRRLEPEITKRLEDWEKEVK
jgi:hypothetical protein